MFANTQMMGTDLGFPDVSLSSSPLTILAAMAHGTNDARALRVIRAGLRSMLKSSRRNQLYSGDRLAARKSLSYIEARLGS